MFKSVERDGKCLGYSLNAENAFFFYGTRNVQREDLGKLFPKFEFFFVNQVHGKMVVPASKAKIEADAHFVIGKNQALVVQSADCVPILLAGDDEIVAIHAGWRGVAREIIRAVKKARPRFDPWLATIGPHILCSSFEVGLDVEAQLLSAAPPTAKHLSFPHPTMPRDRVLFDLSTLVRLQLIDTFGRGLSVEECIFDTKQESLFHSYRRDGAHAGRQYSFVVLNA